MNHAKKVILTYCIDRDFLHELSRLKPLVWHGFSTFMVYKPFNLLIHGGNGEICGKLQRS